MARFNHIKELKTSEHSGHSGGTLIDEKNGAKKNFSIGISIYDSMEYGVPGVHEDQEGFYVLEGSGVAKIGEEEFAVSPGSAFIALDGEPHTIKRDSDCEFVKVLWAHGAV